MHMIINLVNIFEMIYKGFKFGLKVVQSAFMKHCVCKRTKSKPSYVFVFRLRPKRMSVGFIEN